MAEPKTKPTDQPVAEFIDSIPDERIRLECRALVNLMQDASHAQPVMWGSAIIGFGKYPLASSNGKTTDWPLIGFSPRKQALTLYLSLGGLPDADSLLSKLGKYSLGKGCLYIKRLSDVNLPTLSILIRASYDYAVKTKLG
jgi:hypothetical protein